MSAPNARDPMFSRRLYTRHHSFVVRSSVQSARSSWSQDQQGTRYLQPAPGLGWLVSMSSGPSLLLARLPAPLPAFGPLVVALRELNWTTAEASVFPVFAAAVALRPGRKEV
jgi:hypothetical protein